EEEFVKENKVVMEERRLRTDDNPNSLTREFFRATAYQTSPYQNPVIGWMQDLEGLTLEDLQDWYIRWYAPNNATLIVVGDVEAKAVVELAKKYFGPLKPAEVGPPLSRPEVPQFGPKRVVVKKPAKLPQLVMGYKVPVLKTAEDSSEIYALEMLAWVLDGGDSSRFTRELIRGSEVAVSVGTSYDLYARLSSLFTVSGLPAEGKTIKELRAALEAQFERVKTTLVSDEELQRIKTQLIASKVYEKDSIFYQGMQLGMLETVGLDWRLSEEYVDQVSAVTPAQIQAVAQKYLVDEGLTVAVLEPLPLEDKQ
ncbi:MAG: pitrilysin family protein, partial [Pseudomonadota bacterium]